MNCLKRVFGAAAMLFVGVSAAQTSFPNRAVTITVGFAAGGGTDTTARIVAKKLSENIGQPVVVENKPGAGGNLAKQHIASSGPDGYTLHLGGAGGLAAIQPNLGFDPRKDIAPVAMAVVSPIIYVVQAELPARNLKEFVSLAKGKPGELTYASPGMGTSNHLAAAMLAQRTGIELVHVPYKGGGPALTDLLGGRVTVYAAQLPTAKAHVDSGRLRALATASSRRALLMPDVPTVAESGYPGFEVTTWYAFFASSKVPSDILNYWNRELGRVLRDPVVAAELSKQGLDPAPGSRDELATAYSAEIEKWESLVREGKVKLE